MKRGQRPCTLNNGLGCTISTQLLQACDVLGMGRWQLPPPASVSPPLHAPTGGQPLPRDGLIFADLLGPRFKTPGFFGDL